MEAFRVLLTPEAEEVSTRALTIPEQANAIVITDVGSYVMAGDLFSQIKAIRAKVSESFDPIIKKAHDAHKEALLRKSIVDKPLEVAERFVKGRMSDWDLEQENLRKAKEAILQAEARKREEEDRLQAAIEAEQAGAKEEAEEIINEPSYVAPVIVPKAVPKVVGGPVFQTRWSHEVTDLMALVKAVAAGLAPIQAIQANDVFLGQQARSLKDAMRIPGVKSYSKRV
jgi:hypothetical protein